MNTDRSLSELRAELERLDAQRELLSSRLFEAAQRLETPGEPPADELIDGLSDYRQRVHRIGTEIGFFTQTGLGQTASPVTLAELRHAIDQLDRREHVLEVLDQILALTHVETNDFAPLVACHAEARRLKRLATIAHGINEEAELAAIGGNTHPFNQLIRLSEEGSSLSDADWISCNDAVTAAFGRQLATALARGRIVRGTPETDEVEPPVVEKPQPVASISPPAATEPSSFLTMTSHPIVIEEARAISSGPIEKSAPGPDSIFEPSPLEQCVFEEQTPRPKLKGMIPPAATGISPTESVVAGIPRAITRNTSSDVIRNRDRVTPVDRFASLTDHTRRLLAEKRLSLAMHVTRCAELGVKPITLFPPSWLLRAVIVSEHLSEARGELARQLDDDLKSFRAEMLADSDDERQMACGFFLRAAALPAALICGSPAASSVLRAFKIAPGFSQLYNYCSRIAAYGDRLDGQIVEMLRPHSDDAEELEAETVAEEASVWLQETAKKAVSYARSSPLFLHAHWTLTASTSIRHSEATQFWCRWQETLLAAARLLRPVCRNLDSERHAVRQEIARLSSQLRSDSHSVSNDSSSRGSLIPTDEMQSTLHEAIEIASRWLRLSGAKAASISTPMSQDALDLRDEVLERTAGVLSELNAQWHMNVSPLVRTAIVCCRRSIERIHSLFEGSRELDLQEPELRHVLNAELLKIPGLELNEQWLPEIDAEDVERALIEHIEQGDVTWRQAFEAHSMHGDHVATERLLKLNVWSDANELNDLRLRRESQIAEERQVLTRELNDLSIDLETITACGLLDSEDGDIFMRRLERMQRDLTRSSNIGSCRWELDQIRGALQRLRTQPLAAMALASSDRLSATPPHPRSRGDSATMTDQTAMPLSFETAALVTDIFSEE